MHIGVCIVDLSIAGSQSLKEKRRVIKSVKDRVRNKFNVSIAEIGNLDRHQLGTLGIASISNSNRQVNRVLSKVIDFIDKMRITEIAHYEIQMIT